MATDPLRPHLAAAGVVLAGLRPRAVEVFGEVAARRPVDGEAFGVIRLDLDLADGGATLTFRTATAARQAGQRTRVGWLTDPICIGAGGDDRGTIAELAAWAGALPAEVAAAPELRAALAALAADWLLAAWRAAAARGEPAPTWLAVADGRWQSDRNLELIDPADGGRLAMPDLLARLHLGPWLPPEAAAALAEARRAVAVATAAHIAAMAPVLAACRATLAGIAPAGEGTSAIAPAKGAGKGKTKAKPAPAPGMDPAAAVRLVLQRLPDDAAVLAPPYGGSRWRQVRERWWEAAHAG